MKCTIRGCPGEYEQREIVHTEGVGAGIIVVERVPAEVCDVCGDILLTPETVERLEVLGRTPPPPVRFVPLYDFTTIPVGEGVAPDGVAAGTDG